MLKKIVLVLITACVSITNLQAAYDPNTLGANDAMPNALIRAQVGEDTANSLLKTPYKGFYKISSKVIRNKITFPKVNTKQSFPDDRWESLAIGIAGLAEYPAYNTGSRIKPKATAYIAFYPIGVKDIDRTKIMHLPTSTEGQPNTLAILVVKDKSHSKAKNALLGNTIATGQTGSNIYFFELTL